jgi:hypothetical protein
LPAERTTEREDEQDNSFQQAYVNVRAPILAQLERDAATPIIYLNINV